MGKQVFIAEKPSVARQFADALGASFRSADGYLYTEDTVITWCVGHLVTMSYPDAYDPRLKSWSFETLPFLPDEFRYEIIPRSKKQFDVVRKILTDPAVERIYVCTDSGREGEYIYRLVAAMAGVKNKEELRVWIDSQTKEEILRGIREAKSERDYDHLSDAAYLRAKEDYLMGINFSRALTLRYGRDLASLLGEQRCVVAVGRVMTCVLGMVVSREREIRAFEKTPFYRLIGSFARPEGSASVELSWQLSENSVWAGRPGLYRDNGFLKREDAEALGAALAASQEMAKVSGVNRRKEKKNAPLLYNLAELQNECSRRFKMSPDETLSVAQELYEKKLTTYPRTDARVLSTAVAKEIGTNLSGISSMAEYREYARKIQESGSYSRIGKTRYTNDSAITDHYAIIPTGKGLNAVSGLSSRSRAVYDLIVRRFLAIFYPPAVFDKIRVDAVLGRELFTGSFTRCVEEGYREVLYGGAEKTVRKEESPAKDAEGEEETELGENAAELAELLAGLKKGQELKFLSYRIQEGSTQPPRRYNSGSMILAMENAGSLIEDEELREQIRGSGIGTSATRAEILKKLVESNHYLALNKKTQILTPTLLGEMIHDAVYLSIRPLLDPKLTASWEKGLSMVADGSVSEAQYMDKLKDFVGRRTRQVEESDHREMLRSRYGDIAPFYPVREKKKTYASRRTGSRKTAVGSGQSQDR